MGRVGLMHRKRKFVHLHLAVRKDGIGFLEQPHGLFYIVALFQKGLRVPLAALGTKKSPPYTWIAPVRREIGLVTE